MLKVKGKTINFFSSYIPPNQSKTKELWNKLTKYIKDNHVKDHHVFICGDFNAHVQCVGGKVSKFSEIGTNGNFQIDLMNTFNIFQYNTIKSGTRQIDVLFGTVHSLLGDFGPVQHHLPCRFEYVY